MHSPAPAFSTAAALPWPDIEWVLLDMDGTLLDLGYDNWFWRTLVPERYAVAQGISLIEAETALAPRFAEVAHTLPWYCTDYWSRITGLDVAALKRETRERVGLLDGAEDFLRAVRASGKHLWLATNAHPDSWRVKLEKTGLAHYFEHIISSHDFGAPKESQDFWEGMVSAYPFARERTLFADDSQPVLHGAKTFGIGHIRAIACPEKGAARRIITEFTAVDRLSDLLPIP